MLSLYKPRLSLGLRPSCCVSKTVGPCETGDQGCRIHSVTAPNSQMPLGRSLLCVYLLAFYIRIVVLIITTPATPTPWGTVRVTAGTRAQCGTVSPYLRCPVVMAVKSPHLPGLSPERVAQADAAQTLPSGRHRGTQRAVSRGRETKT